MAKIYIDPVGKRTKSIPRFVVLKSRRSLSLPVTTTDQEWLKIPGCKIENVTVIDPTPEYIRTEVARLAAQYPYVSPEQPGLVGDARTLLSAVGKAIQAGASLPIDRVPTWRELYNNRDFFDVREATAMLTLYQGITIQCGGAEKTFLLLKDLELIKVRYRLYKVT